MDPTATLPAAPSEGAWPREYRPSRRQRLTADAIGVASIALGLVFLGAALHWSEGRLALALFVFGVAGLCFVLMGAYCFLAVRRKRVLLFEDAIEFVDFGYGRRRLRRDEIAGIRVSPAQYGYQYWVFEFREAGRKPFTTDLQCEWDAALAHWLTTLPDLNALDWERGERELLESPAFGRTVEERRRALAEARAIVRVATLVALATCAWAWFYPRPYAAVVAALALIPVGATALFFVRRGQFMFDGKRDQARPMLAYPLMLPGLVLAMRTLHDVHVIDWRPLLVWTAVGAVVLTAALMLGDPSVRQRWFRPLIFLPFAATHAWGTSNAANALLAPRAPETFRVAVVGKHISSGKYPEPYLHLAAWGPRPSEDVVVDRALYRAVEIGGVVCVALRPGALGARWFVVHACEEPRSAEPEDGA